MRLRLFPLTTALALLLPLTACSESARKTPIPAAKTDVSLASAPGRETAVFAGGCFWGTQAVFERVKGVLTTAAGYSGGSAKTRPTIR